MCLIVICQSRYKRCPYQILFPKDKSKLLNIYLYVGYLHRVIDAHKKNNSVLVDVEDENVITGDMKVSNGDLNKEIKPAIGSCY